MQLGFDPYNCCGSSAPASCIAAHYSSGSAIPTPNVCASILSILIDCSSIAPSLFPSSMIYTAGPHATALAGCMCYDDDGTYDPDVVDDFASECIASGSAAHPTYYKYGTLFQGFCTNNAGPITASASSTPVVVSTTPQTTPASAGSASVTSASATPVSASATPASASASQQPPTTSANPGSSSTVPLSVAVSTPTSPPASTVSHHPSSFSYLPRDLLVTNAQILFVAAGNKFSKSRFTDICKLRLQVNREPSR